MARVAVLLLAIVPYLNTLDNDFVLDDVPIVQQNSRIRRLEDAGALFTTDYWRGAVGPGVATDPGLYRPLTMASFALNYQVSRQSPRGYHAANIAIHAGVTLVVFHVATMLVPSPVAALGAAAVFAVHPMHTDAVSGVVGRAELLATLFFLLAFAVSVPRRSTDGVIALPTLLRSAAAAALYLLAVLAKESAATLPLVVLLYDWLHRHELPADRPRVIRAAVTRYGFLGVAAAIYLGLRAQAVTQSPTPWIGFVGVSTVDRFMTAMRVVSEYVGMFMFPKTLLADYWKTDVPVARSALEPRVMIAIVLLVGVAAIVWRFRRSGLFAFGTAFFAVTLLPMSNLLFPIGVGKAERILYLPSVGLCLVVGAAIALFMSSKAPRWILPAVGVPVLAVLAAGTVRRNADWHDQLTLALATLRDSPGSPLMSDIAGVEFAKRNDVARAIPLLREAVRRAPEVSLYHQHLGTAYYTAGHLADAQRELAAALQIHPDDPDTHNNLGVVHLAQQQLEPAKVEFLAALHANPNQVDAHSNLGFVYMSLGQVDAAAREFREALRLRPDHPNARRNLANLYSHGAQRAPAPR